ncbi:FAD/NAD(P)-binding domain-containing protein [Tothia fuscella]|uniref:FAD/NAD(P)-binding domain-containing protein n=1 Tax=Tothia fuscella TaxID=1048955 RepID=A0A9P4NEK1_9PEZI|nr:FAD/NAD(P)-binding domain-containing protein [Tothia fuscella]
MADIPQIPSTTIIGAGLAGLTLALLLQKSGIDSRFYELRNPDYDFGGAVMLSPNALRILDNVGAYKRLKNKAYNFQSLTFKADFDFKTSGVYYFGDKEKYQYDALRIHRKVLIAELRAMVQEQGIPIAYGRKFSHVISESEQGVKFAFADGRVEETKYLIGTDGIHSKHAGFPLPVTIMRKAGAYVLALQGGPDGQEAFAGRQFKQPLQDRSGWDALLRDKPQLINMLQHDMSEWSDLVRSGQEQISTDDAHNLRIWPFHTVPKLDKWSSETGRVIIMGDAAHAIPPSSGQGANQAFKDALSLCVVLDAAHKKERFDLPKALHAWMNYRHQRIDKILVLTNQMNNLRLPEDEREKLPQEEVWSDQGDDMGWLYLHDVEDNMKGLLGASS